MSKNIINGVPVVPLRSLVVFPDSVHKLNIASQRSLHAMNYGLEKDNRVLLVTKLDPTKENPGPEDIYQFGVLSVITQATHKANVLEVRIEGQQRASLLKIKMVPNDLVFLAENDDHMEAQNSSEAPPDKSHFLLADVKVMHEAPLDPFAARAMSLKLKDTLGEFVRRAPNHPKSLGEIITAGPNLGRFVDQIADKLPIKFQEKQALLEKIDVFERAEYLIATIESASQVMQVDTLVKNRVKKQMDKSQREYLLHEQMKAIQKELGQLEGDVDEIEDIDKRFATAKVSREVRQKGLQELKKLKSMPPMAAEASVVRGYLEWLISLPWKKQSRANVDLEEAESILEADHYGLDEAKDRILEYLAVHKRVKQIKGSVLCLVGPPGVGKTSLGESIARAMHLKFTRVALGGVRDEAEIRGHRRTYVGSMPGKIIQKIAKVGVNNPLFLLDEIDKMGNDALRGDPASALLEVLDPEQNHTFSDHYLEVDYDLSKVLFICTSNSMNIHPALLDRLEVIRLPGYTEDEKFNIAQRHLLPKQKQANGLPEEELVLEDEALMLLIQQYTKEPGVRGLEREISKLCRKVVKQQDLANSQKPVRISKKDLETYNGVPKFRHGEVAQKSRVGHVLGLAWTEVGGELLDIEAAAVSGQGKHLSTGRLGDVMQESVSAALTYIRDRSDVLGLTKDFYRSYDVHVHVPEGATPKDGPSAGIAMCAAMVSSLTNVAVRYDVAMTGEITLRGQILPVGGLKEKLLAAVRGCVKTVIIPEDNLQDLKEVPDHIKAGLEIKSVAWMDEVLKIALVKMPDAEGGNRAFQSAESSDSVKGTSISSH